MNGSRPLNPPCIFVTSQNFIATINSPKRGIYICPVNIVNTVS